MRLKRCDQGRLRQPKVAIVSRNLIGWNIQIGRVAHVLRERNIFWDNTFGKDLEAELDSDRSLFAARIQM